MTKLLFSLGLLVLTPMAAGSDAAAPTATRVIVLGTGVPTADHERAGAGIAVVHDGRAYLFDTGRGVVQRAIEARVKYDIPALEPTRIEHVFITHLHSDHLHDYPELAGTRWWERERPVRAWGPKGLVELTDHARAMLAVEARTRIAGTPPDAIPNPDGFRVTATEIEAGVVFEDEGIRIEAFTVPHGEIRPAFGYKVITDDRTIVISGDTGYSEELIRQAKGADLLFHEVVSAEALKAMPEYWQDYHGGSHTPADELAKLARETRPGTLVLYHIIFLGRGAEDVLREVTSRYEGAVVLADDLDAF